jgi:hypothetical protein
MDAEEKDVCRYLKSFPGQFVSGREISRRAGGKWKFRQEPEWAGPILIRLVEKGIIESDSTGHFRFTPKDKEKKPKFISPQMKQILKASGKDFDHVIEVEDEE